MTSKLQKQLVEKHSAVFCKGQHFSGEQNFGTESRNVTEFMNSVFKVAALQCL